MLTWHERLPVRTRLILYYIVFFMVAGTHLPYWPTWLKSQGMSAGQISLLLAMGPWIRLLINPITGNLADASGKRRSAIIWCAYACVLIPAQFLWVDGFWSILIVSLLFGAAWAPLGPMGENLTLVTSLRERFDYGRVRLFGSLGFMITTVIGGWLLTGRDADIILWVILAACLLNALTCHLLPDPAIPPAEKTKGAPIGRLLRQPLFILFLIAASAQQATHAMYYGFSVIEWQRIGIESTYIGLLWAEGIIVEVGIFWLGPFILRHSSPVWLMVVGAAAASLRWSLTAIATELPALMLIQVLHGATFGLAYLGAMHFIARAVPLVLSASAQSLFSMTNAGLMMGLGFLASGYLYDWYGAQAYYAMGLVAFTALIGLLCLAQGWNGRTLES